MKINRSFYLFLLSFFTLNLSSYSQEDISWAEAKEKKSASLDLHWYISKPFIYLNSHQNLEGLEVEIIESFKTYVKEEYEVDLQLNWKESKSFYDIIKNTSNTNKPNSFGVSAFSITNKRKEIVKFSSSYLPDVAVLVSSKGTPIVRTLDGINKMMKEMTAVTIKGTTYEQLLIDIKRQLNLDFNTLYIKSDKNILEEISKADDRFGFIDLPIYLMLIKQGESLTRQNFFTIKGDGYGFIMPKNSDWSIIFDEFIQNPKTTTQLARITSKYLGPELYNFIDGLYNEENISASILTKEKELQLEQLKTANLLIQQEKNNQFTYIALAISSSILVAITLTLFYREQKSSKALSKKNAQIEKQQLSIKSKNEQLSNRNLQLTNLNEEKNNLVKILAHDLRSPINQITGLLEILKLSEENISNNGKITINQAQDSVARISQMISKILDFDALEGNRMKVMLEDINVSELLHAIEKELEVLADKKSIEIDYKTNEVISITSDHLFLTQILENIIVNAIKFSNKNTSIEVLAFQKDNKTIFSVKDEGPGFTDEDKSMLFKKFQKLSSKPTNGENSTGLGLSIVKKYVDLLDGEVWVESEKGKGSTFYVALPSV
ncbi:ATP-binding protein [Marivirga arenosa]|uniref:histidine kinase n=1 Tax=Marivirga arenosa TaxID=3059076 RepID=A0AA51N4Z1_9BACT|nr:ATP-binding protein [Marivirga sp. ABR2-2]WMN06074.1 ATP-binding protein [Marivirga sp. ABR2-2]